MRVLNQPLAFVDIETSGGHFKNGRVVEIGIVRVEGTEIRTYQTLLNPGYRLPDFITTLTGIRDQDLQSAPSFGDVAEEISEFLDGAVFVAHNVRFDYSFIAHEYRRLAVDFRPKMLCTVRLSRALYPSYRGHSLDKLIQRFDFEPGARHRALADASVLWDFTQRAIKDFGAGFVDEVMHKQLKQQSIPKDLPARVVEQLPHTSGVYIFEDGDGHPLYVGKSVDIKSRVLSHFTADVESVKELRLAQAVKHISYQETAGELGALLLENQLIKELQPIQNRLQRRVSWMVGLVGQTDPKGYQRLEVARMTPADVPTAGKIYGLFRSLKQAKARLAETAKANQLCYKIVGVESGTGPCFGYQLKHCRGACIGRESSAAHNLRLDQAFRGQGIDDWPYSSPILISEAWEGRAEAHVVDRWCLTGRVQIDETGAFNFIGTDSGFDLDTYRILRRFLRDRRHGHQVRPIKLEELTAVTV